MIIHFITILLLGYFKGASVHFMYNAISYQIPVAVIIVGYVFSVFLFLHFPKLFGKCIFSRCDRKELAKEKCFQAMSAYVAADLKNGRRLWQEAAKDLSNDPLFELLSLINVHFFPDFADVICAKFKYEGEIIKNFCLNSSEIMVKSDCNISKVDNFNMPCLFKRLIATDLENNNIKQAKVHLKKFWKSGKLSFATWKLIRAQIMLLEAKCAKSVSAKISLYKQANKLDRTVAVEELYKFYFKKEDQNAAKKLIQLVWAVEPKANLGELYIAIDKSNVSAINDVQKAKELEKTNENHPVTHFLLARYAMKAHLWALAGKYLGKLKNEMPIVGYMLAARLEHHKNGDTKKVWSNLEKAFLLIAKEENLELSHLD